MPPVQSVSEAAKSGAPTGGVRAISVKDEIESAKKLATQKAEIAESITANRELLRLLVSRGYATDEQRVEIDAVYPAAKKKEKADPAPDASA